MYKKPEFGTKEYYNWQIECACESISLAKGCLEDMDVELEYRKSSLLDRLEWEIEDLRNETDAFDPDFQSEQSKALADFFNR